jgi:hypothetical protein
LKYYLRWSNTGYKIAATCNKIWQDKTRQDKTRQDKTRQDKTNYSVPLIIHTGINIKLRQSYEKRVLANCNNQKAKQDS